MTEDRYFELIVVVGLDMVVLSCRLVVIVLVVINALGMWVDGPKIDVAAEGIHCAALGYMHVPDPIELLQSSSVKIPVLQESGQHRFMSLS